jgi:hypothetical protein
MFFPLIQYLFEIVQYKKRQITLIEHISELKLLQIKTILLSPFSKSLLFQFLTSMFQTHVQILALIMNWDNEIDRFSMIKITVNLSLITLSVGTNLHIRLQTFWNELPVSVGAEHYLLTFV